MKKETHFLFFLLLLIPALALGQQTEITLQRTLEWQGIKILTLPDGSSVQVIDLKNGVFTDDQVPLPKWQEDIRLRHICPFNDVTVEVVSIASTPLDTDEIFLVQEDLIPDEIHVQKEIIITSKKPYLRLSIFPFYRNPSTHVIHKVLSLGLKVSYPEEIPAPLKALSYTPNSVLASGEWYKIAVKESGIHKITYEDLVLLGVDVTNLDPHTIRIFGNGTGMLPEKNNKPRHDDLIENPIYVFGEQDITFDPGDYILFYGRSPQSWILDVEESFFDFSKHFYTDQNFYFLNVEQALGKRVKNKASITDLPTFFVNKFNDCASHEPGYYNLIKSGRIWYGDAFNRDSLTHDIRFIFPDLDPNSLGRMRTWAAARAFQNSHIREYLNGEMIDSISISATDPASTTIFGQSKKNSKKRAFNADTLDFHLNYSLPAENAQAWLRYLEINTVRFLKFRGGQLAFRDVKSVGQDNVAEFIIKGQRKDVTIWDVTDIGNVRNQEYFIADSTVRFRINSDSLHEYIAFDGTFFLQPGIIGSVPNQDLHGMSIPDMVIVVHPLFLDQAEILAQLHRDEDQLEVSVVTTQQVFNEFASGVPDPTAIRDLMKMLYDRASAGNEPLYLLLFGDGSYDNKNRIPNNTNFIPTYQSEESLKHTYTYATDDYFGLLDDGEGESAEGSLDIGVGRLPVTSPEEAMALVEKIINYYSAKDTVYSDWRNVICFAADDGNNNLHFNQAEVIAGIVQTKFPGFNVNKIYFDAYSLQQTPAGGRFPEANKALNKAVERGALVINYTGHGSEYTWSDERVLEISDIQKWKNIDKLPLFITATCEFSRFDNPALVSAGELVLLTPSGGGIALLTTTRLAFSTSNFKLDTSIFHNLIPRSGSPDRRLGDLLRVAKNRNNNNNNIKNFVLLGDPAVRLSYPHQQVQTIQINNHPSFTGDDTLRGLSVVTVSGMISDIFGQKLSDFNGVLYPSVFDKQMTYTTRGNMVGSFPASFGLQNNLLFSGTSTVTNGEFSFSFMVPKDIVLDFGRGKISYYAKSEDTDATGMNDNIIIGGINPDPTPDLTGPSISIFLDNTDFRSGNHTGSNPLLMAFLEDPSGINAFGSGVGHDITCSVDSVPSMNYGLNDAFAFDTDSWQQGWVNYPLEDLHPGLHQLWLKAYDLYNNSSVGSVYFIVSSTPDVGLNLVMVYPNPMKDEVKFVFHHEVKSGNVEALIDIFNLAGRKVYSINKTFSAGDMPAASVDWNGTDARNNNLSGGIYPFRLTLKGNGTFSQTGGKLVIIR